MDLAIAKLFEAAENDDLESVKMLVESGGVSIPSITCRSMGETLANVAARRGNLAMLKYLVEKDSSLVKTSNGETWLDRLDRRDILQEAVAHGHLHIVKYLVEVHNDDIFRQRYTFRFFGRGHGRYSAVNLAVSSGHLNIVKYFIEERHVDPNTNRPPTADYYESEPLLFAAVKGEHYNITKYLIEDRKVDLTVLNRIKQNILFPAVTNCDLDLVKNVLDDQKAEIDINWRDRSGRTLVFWALGRGMRILRYLVEQRKADVNIPARNERKTPLHEALCGPLFKEFKYLVDHGADLEKRDKYGRTALHRAVDKITHAGSKFYKHLLQHGANVKSRTDKGETPLHVAMAAKNLKACKYLIEFSGDVNEKNEDGETLLHFVAARGGTKLVVYLVNEKHALINVAREKDHWTPLHCAAVWGHYDICEYLIKQGADPRAKDTMGRTPAQVASDKALIDYIQQAAEVRSRRSVDHSSWITVEHSVPSCHTHRLTGGQNVEETIWANEINTFHIPSMLAFTNFIIRYLFPSSGLRRKIGRVNDEHASNMENLPNRVVHIAENAVHAFLDFDGEEAS